MNKKLLLISGILILISVRTFSQKFDLIVTNNGDSIACFIDSTGNDRINFKMMKDFEWKSTSLQKNEVTEVKEDAFHNVSIVFKEGTSYILKVTPEKKINSIKDIGKNSVYAELGGTGGVMTLNYERLFAVSKSAGISLRAGIGYISLVTEVNCLIGGPRNYLETGAGVAFDFTNMYESFRIGYSFRAYNGFLLRIAPMLHYNQNNENNEPWSFGYGIALGYSF